MRVSTVSLPMLEAYMAQKHRRLRFPKEIEAEYDRQMDSYRRKVMAPSRRHWSIMLF